MNNDQEKYWDRMLGNWQRQIQAYTKDLRRYRTNATYRLWLSLKHKMRHEIARAIRIGGREAAEDVYGWEAVTAVLRYHRGLSQERHCRGEW